MLIKSTAELEGKYVFYQLVCFLLFLATGVNWNNTKKPVKNLYFSFSPGSLEAVVETVKISKFNLLT